MALVQDGWDSNAIKALNEWPSLKMRPDSSQYNAVNSILDVMAKDL